ncbi:HK97 family phage prohead protease [Microbispora sp. NPDC049125]|uniref:HK97 family phage prohead protease n=1 Tax=Microbispora sp. NPDC049125 TaxID=3154929 RepID=UPI003467BEA1
MSVKTAPRTPGLEYKASTASPSEAAGLIEADEETGLVEAIVSVTGVVDSDNDVIQPGSYAKTLARRRPKGIFSHDWQRWVARTEAIEELMPGDPRLPTTTKDGHPWPSHAGALWVKARFNLDTREGRDAFSNVRFFSETSEAEWSIGYRVPRDGSTRKDGVRHIKEIDLYEYSPVLFGANSMSGTLSVKELDAADGEPVPDRDPSAAPPEEPPAQPDPPVAEPGSLDGPADLEDELHVQALADPDFEAASTVPDDAPALPNESAAEDSETETAEPEEQEGQEQEEEPAKESKAGAPGVSDTPQDERSVAQLKRWYLRGEGAAQIRWGTGGDWERCVRIAGKHMDPAKAKGFCANLHKEATGEWPGPHAHEGGRKADDAPSSQEPTAPEVVESKHFPYLPGSYEELREQIRQHAAAQLKVDHVEVLGTWPERAVLTAYSADSGAASYEVPYGFTAEQKQLLVGAPTEVQLVVGTEGEGEALLPFPGMVDDVAGAVKAFVAHYPEEKAGRVLSGVNATRLKAAVENLVAVLRAAGIEIGQPEKPKEAEAPPPAEAPIDGKVLLPPDILAKGYRLVAEAHARS